ncbi:hypothetical protein PHLCEN_2v10025 [Hermanssonia centrifuga]|uniref:Uncharacterized protein n=1 Tax=Hermanssonia centrifuga TaxID=98765 RepID=A0A2R6NP44_9APHY|nr:hypothetical protein PHLCEN_2v10025 [Hermanssonia centrifuga]
MTSLGKALIHYSIHGLSPAEAKAWYAVMKDIVNVYRKKLRTRGAHIKEGALTTLHRLELEL